MLLRFTVENFMCFRDEATLSLLASTDDRHADHVLVDGEQSLRILKVAAIYGANGHGKTKLFEAIGFVERLVVTSFHGEPLPSVKPFRFAADSDAKPSKFVIEFLSDSKIYEFGVIVDKSGVKEEWLYTRKGQRDTLLYERIEDDRSKDSSGFRFGSRLIKAESPNSKFQTADYLEFLATGVKRDRLFLVEAATKEIGPLDCPFQWFMQKLWVISASATYGNLHGRARGDEKFLPFLSSFFKEADVGINALSVERTKIPATVLQRIMERAPPEMRKELSELEASQQIEIEGPEGTDLVFEKGEDGEYYAISVVAEHGTDGDVTKLDLRDESAGTRRLLDLLPMMVTEGAGTVTYVVDELDRKLHPLLAYKFIEAFVQCPNVQLIFTTHNTQILDLDLLRRDEVWFVQKKSDQAVELYSLADFRVRPDLDVRKGYLSGRFGAIPFVGNVTELGWCSDDTVNVGGDKANAD